MVIPTHHSKTERLPQLKSRPLADIRPTSSEGAALDNICNNVNKTSASEAGHHHHHVANLPKSERRRKIRLGLMSTQRDIARGTKMEKQLSLCGSCSSGGSKFNGNPSTGAMRYTGTMKCRSSWCVSCSARKTTEIAERVMSVAGPQLLNGAKCYFGTLTMSKDQSLGKGYDTLMRAWRDFNNQFGQHIKRKAKGRCWYAGLRGYDVTFKVYEEDKYHHHIHYILVFENDLFSFDWIKGETASRWCKVLKKYDARGSIGAQNLQEVSTNELESLIRYSVEPGKLNKTINKDLRSAGFELTAAYKDGGAHGLTFVQLLDLVKKTDCPQAKECLQAFYNKVHGRRQLSTFGKWRFLEKELEEMTYEGEEVVEESDVEDVDFDDCEVDEALDDELMPGERTYLEFPQVVHNIIIRHAPYYPYSLIGAVMKGKRLQEYNEFNALTRSFPYKEQYTIEDKRFVRDEVLGFISEHTGEVF